MVELKKKTWIYSYLYHKFRSNFVGLFVTHSGLISESIWIYYKVTKLKLTNAVQISINYTIGIRYKSTNWPGTCSIANKKEIIGGSRKKIFK